MTGKLEKKDSETTLSQAAISDQYVKRSRGRPKGAKNKVRSLLTPADTLPKRGRGRPKGAKNKVKLPEVEGDLVVVKYKIKEEEPSPVTGKKRGRPRKLPAQDAPVSEPKVIALAESLDSLENHPLLQVVKWLEKTMHQTELDYYRRRASRNSVSLHCSMASDILGFFNVQNSEICKQIKKNNFIASNSNGLHN
jgi:hypothetical protein